MTTVFTVHYTDKTGRLAMQAVRASNAETAVDYVKSSRPIDRTKPCTAHAVRNTTRNTQGV